jgi:hypothetical protein
MTDSRAPQHQPDTAAVNSVGHQTTLQQVWRLDLLLSCRNELSRTACELSSHGYTHDYDVRCEQLRIEQAVRESYPAAYAAQFTRWIEKENVEYGHDRGVLDPDCRICAILARHSRLNISPPSSEQNLEFEGLGRDIVSRPGAADRITADTERMTESVNWDDAH